MGSIAHIPTNLGSSHRIFMFGVWVREEIIVGVKEIYAAIVENSVIFRLG